MLDYQPESSKSVSPHLGAAAFLKDCKLVVEYLSTINNVEFLLLTRQLQAFLL
jgi:hypothetical protein